MIRIFTLLAKKGTAFLSTVALAVTGGSCTATTIINPIYNNDVKQRDTSFLLVPAIPEAMQVTENLLFNTRKYKCKMKSGIQ